MLKICQNCHAENDTNAQFCHACGERLTDTTTMSRVTTSNTQRKNTSFVVIVVLLIAVIAIGLFLLFNLFQTKTPEIATNHSTITSTRPASTTATSSNDELSQYDEIIAEAKKIQSHYLLIRIRLNILCKTKHTNLVLDDYSTE